jgi:hypothetical protein
MIGIESKGSFKQTNKFLTTISGDQIFADLHLYGRQGVEALMKATPEESGYTAHSWAYKIVQRKNKWHVEWYNTNVVDGVNIAVILQYGHATRHGGYVQGIDYVNPALRSVFENLQNNVWKKVTNA